MSKSDVQTLQNTAVTEEAVENIAEEIAALASAVDNVVTTFDYTPNWPGVEGKLSNQQVAP